MLKSSATRGKALSKKLYEISDFWDFQKSHKISWDCSDFLGFFGFLGISRDFLGFFGFLGISWISGISRTIGFLCIFVDFYG